MKHAALFAVILFLCHASFSQQKTDGLSVEVKLSPELAYLSHKLFTTEPKAALGGGIHIEKGINQYLNAGVGILYRNRGFQHKVDEVDFQGDPIGTRNIKERASYLSFPVSVKGKLRNFYGSLGISVDVFVNSSREYILREEVIQKVNASLSSAVGYHLDLHEQLFLNLEIAYSPMIFSITDYEGPRAYNFGLGFGIGFRL